MGAYLLGATLDRIFTPEDCAAGVPAQELETAAKVGRAADERWHVRKDGSQFWALGVIAAGVLLSWLVHRAVVRRRSRAAGSSEPPAAASGKATADKVVARH